MLPYSRTIAATAILLCTAIPAAAQRPREGRGPVPAPGMGAIGAQITAAMPSEDSWKNGVDVTGSVEGYLSRRVSVRGSVSGAWLDIFGRGFNGTINPVAFNGNVVYNWEGGKWHPYATGGAGLYHYRFSEGITSSSANKFGVDVGGGAEYFFTRHDTLLGEVLVHSVPGTVTSGLTTYQKPSYWTLSGGYKKYFGK
jgi:hypothetical protein